MGLLSILIFNKFYSNFDYPYKEIYIFQRINFGLFPDRKSGTKVSCRGITILKSKQNFLLSTKEI